MPQKHEEIYCVSINNAVEIFLIDYAALDIYVAVELCLST